MTRHVTVELPEEAMQVLRLRPDQPPQGRLASERRCCGGSKRAGFSQGQAASLLGLSRGEFFDLLNVHRVSPVQMTANELEQDFRNG